MKLVRKLLVVCLVIGMVAASFTTVHAGDALDDLVAAMQDKEIKIGSTVITMDATIITSMENFAIQYGTEIDEEVKNNILANVDAVIDAIEAVGEGALDADGKLDLSALPSNTKTAIKNGVQAIVDEINDNTPVVYGEDGSSSSSELVVNYGSTSQTITIVAETLEIDADGNESYAQDTIYDDYAPIKQTGASVVTSASIALAVVAIVAVAFVVASKKRVIA